MKTSEIIHHNLLRRKYGAAGFTLVEMMVVIAILLVLGSIVIGGVDWYKRKAAVGRTTILIASIDRALEDYHSDAGIYPQGSNSTVVFDALYGTGSGTNSGTVYLSILNPELPPNKSNVQANETSYSIIDAWGSEINYNCPGNMNPDFDLWSFGPDGASGLAAEKKDDITNWK